MNGSSDDERFMRLAIEKACTGVDAGQSPFGACIVKDGTVISCAHNVVLATTDITAHAEVTAIRAACRALQTIELSGGTIYSTCEPCPMCFSACHWARLSRIVFGVSIADAQRLGFNELPIAAVTMQRLGNSSTEVVSGCLRDENRALIETWLKRGQQVVY